jgi:hypothetical protein
VYSYPAALFDSSAMPRQANKAVLADAMWELFQKGRIHINDHPAKHIIDPQKREQQCMHNSRSYVLDGGALLHRVLWRRGVYFQILCQLYVDYVTKRYQSATVVFDGYEDGPFIKDADHQRRTGSKIGPTVKFMARTVNNLKKHEFLANKTNKQRFINLLSESLVKAGCKAVNANGDADVLIVQTAVEFAKTSDTVLGDDTYLLVLLYFHSDMAAHDMYFIPEPKTTSTKQRAWNIKSTKSVLGLDICSRLLFIHAILDATPHLSYLASEKVQQ